MRPKIAMLEEENTRQWFFEREQFEAVRAKLPEPVRPVVTFAYLTGWGVNSEVLPLQWRQVDFTAVRVRLEPGTTKNKQGREFPIHRRAARPAGSPARAHRRLSEGAIIPRVFHGRESRSSGSMTPGALPVRRPGSRAGSRTTSDAPPCATWCARAFPSALR